MLLKCCAQYFSQFGKLCSGHRTGKDVLIPIPKKGNAKEYSNVLVAQLCLILCNPMDCSPPGSSVHKIFQTRILEWIIILFSREFSWPRDQTLVCIAGTSFTIWATREAPKCSNYCTIVLISHASKIMLKMLQVRLPQYMNWEIPYVQAVSWETCMWIKKQQLEPDMEQLTGSKLGKEYDKAVNCHPAYLTYMQSTSCERQG